MPGFYMSNLASGMLHPASPTSPNEYILGLPIPPHTQIPLFDASADTGNFIKGILLHREELLGKRVLAATDYYTLDSIVREFNDVTKEGVTAKVVTVSEAEFKDALGQMPEKGKVEMYENMAFMTNYGYYGKQPLEESHKVSLLFVLLCTVFNLPSFFTASLPWTELSRARCLCNANLAHLIGAIDTGQKTNSMESFCRLGQAVGRLTIDSTMANLGGCIVTGPKTWNCLIITNKVWAN